MGYTLYVRRDGLPTEDSWRVDRDYPGVNQSYHWGAAPAKGDDLFFRVGRHIIHLRVAEVHRWYRSWWFPEVQVLAEPVSEARDFTSCWRPFGKIKEDEA